jgi:hypothetical protein
VLGPLILEADLEAAVEERHHLQPLEDRAGRELDGLEDGIVGPERDRGAGPAARRVAHDAQLSLRHAAVRELHRVPLAVAVDFDDELGRQRVDDGHPDAVETAGNLVAIAAELAAAMQLGERDLDPGHLVRGVHVDRDAAAVVGDTAAAVGQERDLDARAVARHRLVHGVVDDLPNEVVQARRAGASDVHAGPFADWLEAFEHGHVLGPV